MAVDCGRDGQRGARARAISVPASGGTRAHDARRRAVEARSPTLAGPGRNRRPIAGAAEARTLVSERLQCRRKSICRHTCRGDDARVLVEEPSAVLDRATRCSARGPARKCSRRRCHWSSDESRHTPIAQALLLLFHSLVPNDRLALHRRSPTWRLRPSRLLGFGVRQCGSRVPSQGGITRSRAAKGCSRRP